VIWRKQKGEIPAWILAVAGFLALLLVVSAVICPVFAPLCCVLLPIFLFWRLEGSTRSVTTLPGDDVPRRPEPYRTALFQRPPPFLPETC
jgi:hypothetical protein